MHEDVQPDSRASPGAIIEGKYEVVRTLGQGGMGIVVLARHIGLDEHVAIKLMSREGLARPEVGQRFLQEARAAAKIKGDHCVRMLDVATLPDGAPYLVMEYLAGKDLQRHLHQRGPLPVTEAVDHVLEASVAVAQAHASGIIHRDLKSSNLFLVERPGQEPIVKVLDFGISKVLPAGELLSAARLTKTSEVFGSPIYMSPEQMRSTSVVDHRTDIWALGVILYELTTGSYPFLGESMPQICARVLADPPAPPRIPLPEPLPRIIGRCLEKTADARFGSVVELAVALAPFAGPRGQAAITKIHAIPEMTRTANAALPSAATLGQTTVIDGAVSIQITGSAFTTTTRERERSNIVLASMLGVGGAGIILVIGALILRGRQHKTDETTPTMTLPSSGQESASGRASEPRSANPLPAPPPTTAPPSEPDDETSPVASVTMSDAGRPHLKRPAPSPRAGFGGRE